MRQGQCDLLLTCCTVILRFEDGRSKAQYPMDAAGAEKVKHFFTAKPDAQKKINNDKNNNNTRIKTPEQQPLPGAALAILLAVPSAFMGLKRQGITF